MIDYIYLPPAGNLGRLVGLIGSTGLLAKNKETHVKLSRFYRAFLHDVTVAILVSQNNETAAMLVYQTNPLGVELFCYVNTSFCFNKFACVLAPCVKTLYNKLSLIQAIYKKSNNLGWGCALVNYHATEISSS